MIIVPDDPRPEFNDECIQAEIGRVFDGDGFLARVQNSKDGRWSADLSFRFAFIDAPEIEQPYGPEAGEFLAGLISNKMLRLDLIGKEGNGYSPVDPYRRLLCMGFLTEDIQQGPLAYYRNGTCTEGLVKRPRSVTRNIELEMIVNGYAWVVEQYAFDREDEYFTAQDDAREHRRGLWADQNPVPPWKFKRQQRERSRRQVGQGRLL